MDRDVVKAVLEALEREGVRYAVFGAAALALHGLPRFTEDLDVFLAPERANVEALKRALHRVFSDPCIDEISADEMLGEFPAVQYTPPEGSFPLDLLTRLDEAFSFESLENVRVRLDELTVSVVSPRTLFDMKRATVRPKDWGDVAALREHFGLGDR